MPDPNRIRRQQVLREAEGYLDLLLVFEDRWQPTAEARIQLAQRALQTLDRLSPDSAARAHACYLRGVAHRCLQQFDEAVQALEQATEMDPENLQIWLELGWCQKRRGRLDLAIQSLEEALAVDPSEAVIYYNLACYWSLAKNSKLAVGYLAHAFDIDPNLRDKVANESDFDPIRKDSEFLALTIAIV